MTITLTIAASGHGQSEPLGKMGFVVHPWRTAPWEVLYDSPRIRISGIALALESPFGCAGGVAILS